MSVIVKNMAMPKNCTGCPICCGLPYQHRDVKGRRPDCPLIELPPHSDLIDRNKLLRRAKKESTYAWKMNLHARTETILNQFIDWLDEAPTVIEAEGET